MHIHGYVEYIWHEDILHLNVTGPFNLKGINEAFAQLRSTVKAAQHTQWYRIEILDSDSLGCLEVMKIIKESYLWSLTAGCKYIAVVCSNSVQMNLLEDFINRTELPIRGFFSLSDAQLAIEDYRKQ
jgi:hypothetical protein